MKRYMIAAGVAVLAIIAGLMFIYQDHHRLNLPPSPPVSPTPTPTPTPIPAHEVYVANMGGNSILGFEIGRSGTVAPAPTRVIQGLTTELRSPIDVATDSAERIYVANLGQPLGNRSSVTVYSATANGDVAPTRTLGTSSSPIPALRKATSVAIRSTPADVLVTDQPEPPPGPTSTPTGRIVEFSTEVMGDHPNDAIGSVEGASTLLNTPSGIGLDQTQHIYVVETTQNRVLGYVSQGHQMPGNLVPAIIIEGPATLLNNPIDAAVDSSGTVFVLNRGTLNPNLQDASITVYAAGAGGNVAPIRRIEGPGEAGSNLREVVGIAVDGGGRIFVVEGGSQGALKVFAAGANGNPAPDQIISVPSMSNPGGISVR